MSRPSEMARYTATSPALLPVTVTSGIASAGGTPAARTGWGLIGAACIEAPARGRLSCLPANGIWL